MGSDSVSEDLVPIVQALALLTVFTMAVTDILARCLFKRPTHSVQSSSGVINNLINFSSLNLVIILVILYKIFVSLVFKQVATYGTTGTLGLLGFVVMNKNVRVHIFGRARRLETATVGGEGLVASLGRLSTKYQGNTFNNWCRASGESCWRESGESESSVRRVRWSFSTFSSGFEVGREEEGSSQASMVSLQ